MTVPTSCRAYRADARSAGRDICGNQDLHVPVLQRARDMQVFLYIPHLKMIPFNVLYKTLAISMCRATSALSKKTEYLWWSDSERRCLL